LRSLSKENEKYSLGCAIIFGEKICLALEPEGTIFELPEEKAILIEITGEENPAIDLQINSVNGELYFSIWPEYGTYELIFKEEDL
jgi:hypothetical protein